MEANSLSNDPEGRLPLLVAWDLIVRHGGYLDGVNDEEYAMLIEALSSHRNLAADLLQGLIHAVEHDPEQGGSRFVRGAVEGAADLASSVQEKSSIYMTVLLGAIGGISRPVGAES